MNTENLYEAIGYINEKRINSAHPPKANKKPVWVKFSAMAACLAVAAALGAGLFQNGWFGNSTDIAMLNNGDTIAFEQSDALGGSLSLNLDLTVMPLTENEAASLFGGLPVKANAVFKTGDMDAGTSRELIGFEGQIENVKAVISTSDVQLLDTVIAGTEETAEINGVSIVAGYFITEPNSKGEQNAIYYAAFDLGSCKVYLENAGTKDNREAIKNQLAEVIQKLIENGEPDLSFLDNEAAGLDGSPDGYSPPPNNRTADEEVSEQDPAEN